MCPAALPRRNWQYLTNRMLDPQVGLAGDQVHLVRPAGFQVAEKPVQEATDSAVATCMPSNSL